jgi:hypothetical protein
MKLELNNSEATQLKELLFNEIDRLGNFRDLSDELQAVLRQLCSKQRDSSLYL